jgi:hypothetical protein
VVAKNALVDVDLDVGPAAQRRGAVRVEPAAQRNEREECVEDAAVKVDRGATGQVQPAEARLDRPPVHAGDAERVEHYPPLHTVGLAVTEIQGLEFPEGLAVTGSHMSTFSNSLQATLSLKH